jgi:hypothetical protein
VNLEIKARWIAALRSGQYRQGTGALCRLDESGDPSYCCLGVLTRLAEDDGVVRTDDRDAKSDLSGKLWFVDTDNATGTSAFYLTPAVRRWSGLTGHNPTAGGFLLTHLNDEGYTFAEIADKIEGYL